MIPKVKLFDEWLMTMLKVISLCLNSYAFLAAKYLNILCNSYNAFCDPDLVILINDSDNVNSHYLSTLDTIICHFQYPKLQFIECLHF